VRQEGDGFQRARFHTGREGLRSADGADDPRSVVIAMPVQSGTVASSRNRYHSDVSRSRGRVFQRVTVDAWVREKNRVLHVGNLPYDTTETGLHALFATAGAVRSVQVMRHQETGYPRGFAFVEMATNADAMRAIDRLHDSSFGGRTLAVNHAGRR
jgi:RNA recognition motif